MPKKYTPQERIVKFWEKVDCSGGDDACWNWQAGKRNGYGQVWWNKKWLSAHRVAYEIANEPPGELDVLHSCDNPSCCNPRHLSLGTHADNMQDMLRKGRANRANNVQGRAHGMARLSDAQVIEIRSRYASGGATQDQLALEYGVCQAQIGRIVRRARWKHLP